MVKVRVVGAGLAGCEAAWQLAERGIDVELIEQKPLARTPAQTSDWICELVCSNSMRGAALVNAVGLLKEELRRAGSLIMECAEEARVPAGGALAGTFAISADAMTSDPHRRSSSLRRPTAFTSAAPRIEFEHTSSHRLSVF